MVTRATITSSMSGPGVGVGSGSRVIVTFTSPPVGRGDSVGVNPTTDGNSSATRGAMSTRAWSSWLVALSARSVASSMATHTGQTRASSWVTAQSG